MVNTYTGKGGWAGLGIEATPGTQVDPSVFIPFDEITTTDDVTTVEPVEHRGTFDSTYHIVRTAADGKVGLKFDAFPEMGLEHAMYGLFGDKSSAASSGGYKHTFTLDSSNTPTFSIHSGLTTTDTGTYKPLPKVYNNAMVDELKIDIKEKEALKLDVSYETTSMILDATPVTPTYASNNPRPFVFPDVTFKIADFGSSAVQDPYVQSLSLDFKKEVKKEWTANGSLGPSVMVPTVFELTGSMSKIFTDMEYYRDFLGAGKPTAFSRTLMYKNVKFEIVGDAIPSSSPSTNYQMDITIPKILITSNEIPYGGDEMIKADMDIRAIYDTVTGQTAQVDITSGLASIT